MRLIQTHLDRYGVKRAEFARRIGTTPQTVQNWKTRSTTLPKVEHLKGVAAETGIPYSLVLEAALVDAGLRDSLTDDLKTLRVRIARYVRYSKRGVGELQDFLSANHYIPDAGEFSVWPGMTAEDIDRLIDKVIAEHDQYDYANDTLYDRELLHDRISDLAYEEDEVETALTDNPAKLAGQSDDTQDPLLRLRGDEDGSAGQDRADEAH